MKANAKIGILGGGFAGIYVVSHLQKYFGHGIDVTLFDKNNYLLYTPVLHEMAMGTVNARHVVVPLRKVINPRLVHIRCEEVLKVGLKEKVFETPSGRFSFDFLVLAQGSESNFYSIPGVKENSITLKTVEDAIRLRNMMIGTLERAALETDSEKRKRLLTITVAGGGCTGAEVVTEVAQFIQVILNKDYPEITPSDVRIYLIEGLDRVLPSFPFFLSEAALQRMRRMGIEILLDSFIQSVNKDVISLRDGHQIPHGILVWAGGVQARKLLLEPQVEQDQNHRILVNEPLQIPGRPGVYAIGDGAHVIKDGSPLPPTASVAVQEARYVARDIVSSLGGNESPPFRFHYRGDMASLGFMYGVAEIYGRHFKGAVAWFLWKAFKLGMLPRYKNRFQILADWLITLLFRRDTSKLM